MRENLLLQNIKWDLFCIPMTKILNIMKREGSSCCHKSLPLELLTFFPSVQHIFEWRLKVLTVRTVKVTVLWDVMSCGLVDTLLTFFRNLLHASPEDIGSRFF